LCQTLPAGEAKKEVNMVKTIREMKFELLLTKTKNALKLFLKRKLPISNLRALLREIEDALKEKE